MEGVQEQPGAQPDAKRRRQEPLTEAQEREAQQMLLPRDLTFKMKQSSGPVHPRAVKARLRMRVPVVARLKHLVQAEEYHTAPPSEPTFVSIQAPPSLYPPKKFCDLTGQLAKYTDPKTRLQYADAADFAALRRLTPEAVNARLALRRAAFVLK